MQKKPSDKKYKQEKEALKKMSNGKN